MQSFWEFLQKLARRLRQGAAAMNTLASAIELLLATFGGPGLGFAS